MDENLARITINTAMRAARDIGGLAPLLKDHCDPEVREPLRIGVGTVVHEIYASIVDPILERFPTLKAEIEANVERYGAGV